jgi:hypothetical protein
MDLVTYCAEAIGEANTQTIDQTLELYAQWATF